MPLVFLSLTGHRREYHSQWEWCKRHFISTAAKEAVFISNSYVSKFVEVLSASAAEFAKDRKCKTINAKHMRAAVLSVVGANEYGKQMLEFCNETADKYVEALKTKSAALSSAASVMPVA